MTDQAAPHQTASRARPVSGWAVGFTLAVLSATANFLFLPYYPFWALTVVALDVFVIWALTAHGHDLQHRNA